MQAALRSLARRLLPKGWRVGARNLRAAFRTMEVARRLDGIEQNLLRMTDLVLRNQPLLLAEPVAAGSEINRFEFRMYSQCGEDGILLYIFSRVGTTDRRFVELGIGEGVECTTANLSLNFGWRGVMIDGGEHQVRHARHYYRTRIKRSERKVRILSQFITAENVNDLLREAGATGEVDLLSIDVDGNDYWIWRALEVLDPRVVAIAYNASLPAAEPLTIAYDPAFRSSEKEVSGYYHGASLGALAKLGAAKGYELVGCTSAGVDAFFVRSDVARGQLAGVSVDAAYFPCGGRPGTPAEQFEHIAHLPFEKV